MFDIAIATTCQFSIPYGTIKDKEGLEFRKGTFFAMLESLRALDWCGQRAVLCIRDDSDPWDFPQLPNIGMPVHLVHNWKRAGCPLNLTLACDDAQKLAPLVLYVDNDGLFSKDCIKRLLALIASYPDRDAFSVFNTKYHENVADLGDHVLKASVCEHGLCFRTKNWDYNKSYGGIDFRAAAQISSPYPTLKPSGVQHCGGKWGLNGVADDFDPEFRP